MDEEMKKRLEEQARRIGDGNAKLRASIAATRQFIEECTFDAITDMLGNAGIVTNEQAAVMCEHLAGRLGQEAIASHDDRVLINRSVLDEEIGRLLGCAALRRARHSKPA